MNSDSDDDKRQEALRKKRMARKKDDEEDEEDEIKVISSSFKDVQITATPQEPTLGLDQVLTPGGDNEKIEINEKNLSQEKKSRFTNRMNDEDEINDVSPETKKSFGRDQEENRSHTRDEQERVQRNREVLENENSFFSKKNK
jgi:hypothetical protein